MRTISVIIASWNAKDHLRRCLESLRRTGSLVVQEVIVVDNASSDGSPDMVAAEFPEVTLLRQQENLGFAKANNLGISRSAGKYLALINSDVLVHPECLQQLASYLEENPAVGLVGPKVMRPDGRTIQNTCRRLPRFWNTFCRCLALDALFPKSALFTGWDIPGWKEDAVAEVEVLIGCFWVARRSAASAVGKLDERFFFYAEDVDWSKRFVDAGWKVVYVPDAVITHYGGASSANAPILHHVHYLQANLAYLEEAPRDPWLALLLRHRLASTPGPTHFPGVPDGRHGKEVGHSSCQIQLQSSVS